MQAEQLNFVKQRVKGTNSAERVIKKNAVSLHSKIQDMSKASTGLNYGSRSSSSRSNQIYSANSCSVVPHGLVKSFGMFCDKGIVRTYNEDRVVSYTTTLDIGGS